MPEALGYVDKLPDWPTIEDGGGKSMVQEALELQGELGETLAAAGELNGALNIAARFENPLAKRLAADSSSVHPSYQRERVLVSILEPAVLGGDFEIAKRVVAMTPDKPRVVRILGDIAEFLARTGDTDKAKQALALVPRADSDGKPLTPCQSLAIAKVRLGDVAGALRAADKLHDDMTKGKSSTLERIAGVRIESGDLTGALETARRIDGEYTKSDVYFEIALAQMAAGKRDAALHTIERIPVEDKRKDALAILKISGSDSPRDGLALTAYDSKRRADYVNAHIALLRAKRGEFDAAKHAADVLFENTNAARCWAKIAAAQLQQKEVKAAQETLHYTLQTHCRDRGEPYVAVAEELARAGDIVGLRKTARRMFINVPFRDEWKWHLGVAALQRSLGDEAGAQLTTTAADSLKRFGPTNRSWCTSAPDYWAWVGDRLTQSKTHWGIVVHTDPEPNSEIQRTLRSLRIETQDLADEFEGIRKNRAYWEEESKQATEFANELRLRSSLPPTMTNSIGMKLVLVPAGEFMMGSPESVKYRASDEEPQHRVRITKPFYLGVCEVTQGQWEAVMGTRPWQGKANVKQGADYPATHVSWADAVDFCWKLSAMEEQRKGHLYGLPTEAEWEYACRAGSTSAFCFGNNSSQLEAYAWIDDNTRFADEEYAHRVRQKRANAWGLHDMHGNVFEWCSDWYQEDYYAKSSAEDPPGPTEGSHRVIRGGSWYNWDNWSWSAFRNRCTSESRNDRIGFRVVWTP